ncbi:MAG: ATP-binding cassette subfamily F protein 3 [Chlamydiales bacterium]|jgi:ATP-binding cassette subfamily F protein 3
MVQVENISKSYGDRILFSGVSFHVGDGERCAIVGRNGCGKSTMLKILSGLEELSSGHIRFPKGIRIGSLPQHLVFNQDSLMKEALLGLPAEQRDEEYRVEKILSGLGFTEEDFYKEPNSFSGGFQLRLALCKVLVGEPELLLLDEPTNYLDIITIRWLERYLRSWQGQILFVSHDRSFVNSISTHIIGFHRGQVVKSAGDLKKYHEMIVLQEETHEKTREKLDKKKAQMQSFVDRFGAKASKATQAQSRLKAIDKMDTLEALQGEEELDFSFHYKRYQSKKMFSVEDMHFKYNKESQDKLIHGLNFELANGERLAVIGKNGRGKSTVLRLLSGELKADSGDYSVGQNVEMAVFGQTNIDRLDTSKTIDEEVQRAMPSASYAEVRKACGVMQFSGDDAKKKISVLSGGERSRVLLAKILLTPANLLLLDEPTHHLDIESVDSLMDAIKHFKGTVVLVSHDESILRKFRPNKMIICSTRGQEVFLGGYDSFLEKGGWDEGVSVVAKVTVSKTDRKEDRRLRAERVQARSKAMRPIKQGIEKAEAKIEKLEEKKLSLEGKIVTEANESDYDMHSLATEHGNVSKSLDSLYEELQNLFEKEEGINQKFQ